MQRRNVRGIRLSGSKRNHLLRNSPQTPQYFEVYFFAHKLFYFNDLDVFSPQFRGGGGGGIAFPA
jgi:hypothetical protein